MVLSAEDNELIAKIIKFVFQGKNGAFKALNFPYDFSKLIVNWTNDKHSLRQDGLVLLGLCQITNKNVDILLKYAKDTQEKLQMMENKFSTSIQTLCTEIPELVECEISPKRMVQFVAEKNKITIADVTGTGSFNFGQSAELEDDLVTPPNDYLESLHKMLFDVPLTVNIPRESSPVGMGTLDTAPSSLATTADFRGSPTRDVEIHPQDSPYPATASQTPHGLHGAPQSPADLAGPLTATSSMDGAGIFDADFSDEDDAEGPVYPEFGDLNSEEFLPLATSTPKKREQEAEQNVVPEKRPRLSAVAEFIEEAPGNYGAPDALEAPAAHDINDFLAAEAPEPLAAYDIDDFHVADAPEAPEVPQAPTPAPSEAPEAPAAHDIDDFRAADVLDAPGVPQAPLSPVPSEAPEAPAADANDGLPVADAPEVPEPVSGRRRSSRLMAMVRNPVEKKNVVQEKKKGRKCEKKPKLQSRASEARSERQGSGTPIRGGSVVAGGADDIRRAVASMLRDSEARDAARDEDIDEPMDIGEDEEHEDRESEAGSERPLTPEDVRRSITPILRDYEDIGAPEDVAEPMDIEEDEEHEDRESEARSERQLTPEDVRRSMTPILRDYEDVGAPEDVAEPMDIGAHDPEPYDDFPLMAAAFSTRLQVVDDSGFDDLYDSRQDSLLEQSYDNQEKSADQIKREMMGMLKESEQKSSAFSPMLSSICPATSSKAAARGFMAILELAKSGKIDPPVQKEPYAEIQLAKKTTSEAGPSSSTNPLDSDD